jgi:hypothetical protein
MFANFLMKKPILVIGVLMFAIFLMHTSGRFPFFDRENLQSTPCHAALIKIQRNTPKEWKIYCESNNLTVEILEKAIHGNPSDLKEQMYRQLANHLVLIARHAQADLMEKILIVRLKHMHPHLEINAITEGRYMVKLAGLSTPQFIAEHLQQTVQVNDIPK